MPTHELKRLFGRRVRVLRKINDMTQERLAALLNCSTEYISRIERGLASPSFEIISKLSSALSVEPRDLFSFSEVQPVEKSKLSPREKRSKRKT